MGGSGSDPKVIPCTGLKTLKPVDTRSCTPRLARHMKKSMTRTANKKGMPEVLDVEFLLEVAEGVYPT